MPNTPGILPSLLFLPSLAPFPRVKDLRTDRKYHPRSFFEVHTGLRAEVEAERSGVS